MPFQRLRSPERKRLCRDVLDVLATNHAADLMQSVIRDNVTLAEAPELRAHQRLRDAPVPVNDDLSAFHRQLRRTADHVISAGSDDKRRRYFTQLLAELDVYQEKLRVWEASPQVTEPVRRLVEMLHKYQHVLTSS